VDYNRIKKIIISGGGTGGHIFPAIAIANALKIRDGSCQILFVGAEGKMEMKAVPAAGYEIIGLPIRGLQRKLSFSQVTFVLKLMKSLVMARKIFRTFKPDVVVGVGGYASGPILRIASKRGIPTLIQEQNSYAGITNKLLSRKVNKVCVSYEGMEKFFPPEKIIFTGNPVRQDIADIDAKFNEGLEYFKIRKENKTVLVLGGSLGARTINESIAAHLDLFEVNKLNLIWQTGKEYFETAKESAKKMDNIDLKVYDFISRMDLAYSVADVVISRAGASTVSELCIVKKPSILVPSPNVAEDHQTKNAMALVKKEAAIMIKDSEAGQCLVDKAIQLINNEEKKKKLSENISRLAINNSAELIAGEIFKLIEVK